MKKELIYIAPKLKFCKFDVLSFVCQSQQFKESSVKSLSVDDQNTFTDDEKGLWM